MTINTAFSGGTLTLYLSGELDHHEARQASKVIDELIDDYLPRQCILDLKDLSFMDSSGIALIIKMNRRLNTIMGRMWIENPNNQPMRVLSTAKIERLVPIAVGGKV